MIEKFLSTAVDVAGTMKLPDSEVRTPYFSGVIVKDAEVFAVTIGNGLLAFLQRRYFIPAHGRGYSNGGN